MWRTLLPCFALLLPGAIVAAPPALAAVFTNSMVLQRDVRVPVWGTADAGTAVTVTFAEQRAQTKADDKGRWAVRLEAMKADAEPRELKVVAGDTTLTVRDVLVGEVWVAAGQSNMEWPLANEAHVKTELPAADRPHLRLLNLNYAGQSTAVFGPDVLKRLTPDGYYRGTWQPCFPKSAKDFSAVGQARGGTGFGPLRLATVLHRQPDERGKPAGLDLLADTPEEMTPWT